jgi:hypothetical protein
MTECGWRLPASLEGAAYTYPPGRDHDQPPCGGFGGAEDAQDVVAGAARQGGDGGGFIEPDQSEQHSTIRSSAARFCSIALAQFTMFFPGAFVELPEKGKSGAGMVDKFA